LAFDSDVAALFTQDGAPSQRINAVVNVPLIDNQLGLRVAGTYNHEGGWIDKPAADRKDIDGQNRRCQGQGTVQPNLNFAVSVMAVVNRNDRSIDVSDQTAQDFTQAFRLTTTPRWKNDYDLYNLTLTYDFSSARVLSTTSYLKAATPIWNQGNSTPTTASGAPFYVYYAPAQRIDDRVLTEELRLTSIGSGPWQWTVGGFYRHYRDSFDNHLIIMTIWARPVRYCRRRIRLPRTFCFKSWSAFGDASYKLWDD